MLNLSTSLTSSPFLVCLSTTTSTSSSSLPVTQVTDEYKRKYSEVSERLMERNRQYQKLQGLYDSLRLRNMVVGDRESAPHGAPDFSTGERERERQRDRGREAERQRERERGRGRERQRDMERETEGERDREFTSGGGRERQRLHFR